MLKQKHGHQKKKETFHIKKDDLVEVNTGEEKGRRGRVLEIFSEKKQAIVEGINLVKKHQRARSQTKPSGIVSIPAAVHISNLVLICSKCGKKTSTRREKIERKRTRICKACGEIVE
ncbi:50S ribosomal protein L24 [candidate division WOR-3 bacterium RBG_13_43_14]|uniref:Large ribosomal subunit protein uL24 n=1 Tax=candidate division WOR-3 bacterium RBG_13_43_14 TaxID=1802590 RepID=A0A1F4UDS0_UNCW3|nr:MAG: 50S ribosomal protein L24 [candidate division WOR-3 bacterium RBG_13_43_14]